MFLLFYRRQGGVRKEIKVKIPFHAIEKWFEIEPGIFKQNPGEFKNKLVNLQIEYNSSFLKQPCET